MGRPVVRGRGDQTLRRSKVAASGWWRASWRAMVSRIIVDTVDAYWSRDVRPAPTTPPHSGSSIGRVPAFVDLRPRSRARRRSRSRHVAALRRGRIGEHYILERQTWRWRTAFPGSACCTAPSTAPRFPRPLPSAPLALPGRGSSRVRSTRTLVTLDHSQDRQFRKCLHLRQGESTSSDWRRPRRGRAP